MPELKQIIPPGSAQPYDLVDQGARDLIADLGNFTEFLGVTTTPLVDGSTTNPVVIDGESVTADRGDIVTYNSLEFIWNGSAWQEFGDLSALGALAFADTASGNFTPAGTVTLVKTNKTATVSPAASGDATYTPAGTVNAPNISLQSAGATSTVHNPTAKTMAKSVVAAAPGTSAPANVFTYCDVVGESLRFYQMGYTTEDSITTSDLTVKTGDGTYGADAPAFTGTGVRLETGNILTADSASFSGTQGSVQVSPD